MTKKTTQESASPWLIFGVTSLGVGMATIDGGIVNVALPTLTKIFQTNLSMIQWIVSGYLLMICVLLPLSGYLGDIFTRKIIYLSGFAVFTLTSFLCGLAFSLPSLIFYRFLQGIGAAMIIANNQAIILSNFPKHKRAYALGINSMIVALGAIAGPSLGGFLIGLIGWRSIFYINIPLGLLGCFLGYKILPKEQMKRTRHFDFLGAFLFAVMMVLFVLTLTHGSQWGWRSLKTFSVFLTVIIFLALLLICEYRVKLPMINLTIFKNSAFSLGNIILLFIFMALAANTLLLPFYLDQQLHLSPQIIGLILFVAPICILVISPISGYLTERFNQAYLVFGGAMIIFVGLFAESFANAHTSIFQIIAGQATLGIGWGLFNTPNNYSILKNVPENKLGVAAGITSLVRNIARVGGITMATSIFATLSRHIETTSTSIHKNVLAFNAGFKGSFLTVAAFVFIAAILALDSRKLFERIYNYRTRHPIQKEDHENNIKKSPS